MTIYSAPVGYQGGVYLGGEDGERGDAPTDKLSKVQFWYGCLFFPKSQMSEFYIWREDFEERVKINGPLDDIRDRLWELLK